MTSSSLSIVEIATKKTSLVESPSSYNSINVDEEQHLGSIRPTLSSEAYDAATIRAEFQTYHSMLPKPDKLLQQHHSVGMLRQMIERESTTTCTSRSNTSIEMPRFLQPASQGGIAPHHALCCLLLDDFHHQRKAPQPRLEGLVSSWLVWAFSFGCLYRQLHVPAAFIHDQFYRVAHVIPSELVRPTVLRHTIRNRGLPIPNFFLDPEDPKQFPPHIAMLVILQDGETESRYLRNHFHRLAWCLFAFVALVLRLVLEVIGGAGAIWGGSEVFLLRNVDGSGNNNELWRGISMAVGVFCFLRFVTLNAPQKEDEGDILGPAGPWSLRTPARLRAVCEHPFHYFCRAQPPYDDAPNSHNNNHKYQ